MKKYYEIENLDERYNSLDEAKRNLEKILYDEANYNYFANKDKTYALLEVTYDEAKDEYNYSEILPSISVKDFKEMSFDDKEKYFKRG